MEDKVLPTIVHDLRNPLTSIIGYAQLVLGSENGLGETDRRNLEMLLLACGILDRMLGSLAMLGQLRCGVLDRGSEVVAQDVLQEAVRAIEPVAAAQQKIVRLVAVNVRATIRANEELLSQALQNGLAHGLTRVRAGQAIIANVKVDGDGRWVEFLIEDCGPDLPEGLAEAMMDPTALERVRTAGVRSDRALGLVLVREAAFACGGEAKLTSSNGVTRLSLRLPAAAT
ncbi:MAG: HAMP domain-containing histidine kinase [Nitrospirae bacterium]|nr:HAMP domain-containing histidine kinase [Nitrospirota bacterium]